MLGKSEKWPVADYRDVMEERAKRLAWLVKDKNRVRAAKAIYKEDPIRFIEHWAVVREPREVGSSSVSFIPFVMFQRQKDLIEFVQSLIKDGESGLVEKSRDMGATWTCCWISIWLYLFLPGATVGWGSREADLVDQKGNPDSIMEKIR